MDRGQCWVQSCSISSLMVRMMGHCTLSKFPDDTNWQEWLITPASEWQPQRVVLPSSGTQTGWRMELQARNLLKSNKQKCKVLHWGGTTPGTGKRWTGWKAALQKRVLVDAKLNMTCQQCACTGRIRTASLFPVLLSPSSSLNKEDREAWIPMGLSLTTHRFFQLVSTSL